MCKFQRGDRVRVIEPDDPRNDQTGTITHIDTDFYYTYEVTFDQGQRHYAAHHLVLALALGEQE